MSRIAFVGLDRQIHVVHAGGENSVQLSSPVPRTGGGTWSMLKGSQDAWSWPTWSAVGDWLAAFSVETSDQASGPVRVVAMSLDGVRQVEWAQIQNMAPIYLQWHPGGDALTVLMQQNQELVLGLLRRDRLGQVRPLEHGVPLFFNWSPGGGRVLIHVGGSDAAEGRLVLRDPLGDAEDVLLDSPPGSFCAPVFVGQQAVYAVRYASDGHSEVVVSDIDGSHRQSLARRKGLLAIVGPPQGTPWIAVSHAPRGEGTPYRGIDLIHLEDHRVVRVSDADCLAFFWSPTGDYLLQAQVDVDANCLIWQRIPVDGGPPVALGTFWPTRDLLFYLHFFEQYATSHSLFSSDGRQVVFAGYPAGGGQADLSSPPRIYVKDVMDPESPPIEVGRGSFAVFSPVP